MPASPPPLEYAPSAGLLRRKRVRRVLLMGLLVAFLGVALRWGKPAVRFAGALYWQRQCMNYSPAADFVVYDSDPASAPALLQAGHGYTAIASSTLRSSGASILCAGYTPAYLNRLNPLGYFVPAPPGAVLFMHERATPAGQKRLVIVRSDFDPLRLPLFINGFDVTATLIEPETVKKPMRDRTGGSSLSVLSSTAAIPPRLRIFAGQIDPADETHFTLRYQVDGAEHVVDGYVRDGWPAGYATIEFKKRETQ